MKKILVLGCHDCPVSQESKLVYCHRFDIRIKQNIINKTIHPKCKLEDDVSFKDVQKKYFSKHEEYTSALPPEGKGLSLEDNIGETATVNDADSFSFLKDKEEDVYTKDDGESIDSDSTKT